MKPKPIPLLGASQAALLLGLLTMLFLNCCPDDYFIWDGNYGIGNGLKFYEPETGETGINRMVFVRGGCEVMFKYKGGKGVAGVQVEVIDAKNRAANTVTLSAAGGIWSGTWNDWTSPLWTAATQIPVGEFTANFKVQQSGGATATRSVPFYVIFDPQEVKGDYCFGFEETAIWFGSGTNSDRGLTYALHPDDQRIFEIAAAQVRGETESFSSAQKLSHWVSSHWSYSLNYHTNDALDLLLNHTSAQCADEACFLVALLRAVGIPAHPATADAGVEVGAANWNFDTWTEAKLMGSGKPVDWYILHPHEYPTLQPTPRANFGSSYGVATKASDDLIIMANCGWLGKTGEVTDYATDVSYGRNSCQEPNQTFTKIASWIDHLCNPGYWGVGHWGCSPAETTAIRIVIPVRAKLRVGDVLNFQTIILGLRSMEDTLAVRIVSNDIRSHAWPDAVLTEFRYPFRLERGDSTQFNYTFKIPGNLVATNETLIEARAGDDRRYFIARPVEIAPRFEWTLLKTTGTRKEPQNALVLTLENVTAEAINQVVVKLKPPFGVTVETPVREIDALPAMKSVQVTWRLPSQLPRGIAMATIIIESKDGGIVEIATNIGQ